MKLLIDFLKKNKVGNNQSGNNNINIQHSQIYVESGFKNVLNLAKENECTKVLNELNTLKSSIESQHPYFPHWRYDVSTNSSGRFKISHVPISNEAVVKYPPRGTMKFNLPEEYKWAKNMDDLINYGYQKQIPIQLELTELKAWIGELLIEDKKSESKGELTLEILPRKFPAPIPMRLEFQDKSFSIDYLEMAIIEIDGSKIIISNEKQDLAKIILKINIDFKNKENCRFSINVSDKYKLNVEANLIANDFMIKSNRNVDKKLILLKEGKELLRFNKINFDEEDKELKNRYNLLRQLRKLEKYYNIEFVLPEKNITDEEFEKINILNCAMKNKAIKGTYTDLNLSLEINKSSNQYELLSNTKLGLLTMSFKNKTIDLFNQTIKFKESYIEFHDAKLKDKENVIKKLDILDDKDIINIQFIPDKDNTFKEFYKI